MMTFRNTKTRMITLLTLGFAGAAPLPAVAGGPVSGDRAEVREALRKGPEGGEKSRDSGAKAGEAGMRTGWVRCRAGTHDDLGDCQLEFVGDGGESFPIDESDELMRLHCSLNAELRVRLETDVRSKFLFFGKKRVVKSFEVLDARDPGACDESYKRDQLQAEKRVDLEKLEQQADRYGG